MEKPHIRLPGAEDSTDPCDPNAPAFFRAMFEKHPDKFALLDDTGSVIAVNPAWRSCLEQPSHPPLCALDIGDNALALSGRSMESEAAEVFDRILGFIEAIFAGESHGESCEYRMSTDDADRWFHIVVTPLTHPFSGVLLMYAETTDHKASNDSESLLAHNRELENRMEEQSVRSRRTEQMMIQQSKMTSINDMIAAIAHQWMSPISAISIIVQNLRVKYVTKQLTEEAIDATVRDVLVQVRQMTHTIDQFRTFFKPSVKDESFDVGQAIIDVLGMFHVQLLRHNIIATVSFTDDDSVPMETVYDNILVRGAARPAVLGYPSEFKQTMLNILNNSRDAVALLRRAKELMPLSPGYIFIDIEEEPRHVIVRVRDNGGGIPAAIIEKIFTPYFTTKETLGATGIGLYLAKAIIENTMKGTISAGNWEKGTMITMRLVRGRDA